MLPSKSIRERENSNLLARQINITNRLSGDANCKLACYLDEDGSKGLGRHNTEQTIKHKFSEIYQAEIDSFLPLLVTLEHHDECMAALGLRPAVKNNQETNLFVEQYLDGPVESILADVLSTPVNRQSIIEIGNFISIKRGCSQLLLALLTGLYPLSEFRWGVFTAVPEVSFLLEKLNISFTKICRADGARIGNQLEKWGTYYDRELDVVVMDIEKSYRTLKQQDITAHWMQQYEQSINAIASKL